ncbi:hypothetical protein DACRYDRAFT_24591 [Dacryopinax primogenitus]|uniref:Uncharacterized protein n=1 Tax=Dacryopinax primogenitus (strain DJM 731) TaxID=1858805 RepID=M5FNX9_DACPD|nr:uncharacterized protein DACRYDRAFT_24591 [Dacryopinax primogenitus]EJT98045.1 hypothetical protein DACRYDRAFT_24591 [Dacryopinax primogenitus]
MSAIPTNLVPSSISSVFKALPTDTNVLLSPGGSTSDAWWNTDAPTIPVSSPTGTLPSSSSVSPTSPPTTTLTAAIAGGVGLLILIGILVYFLHRRSRKRPEFRHKKRRSLGSRSSFGFTIRPGAIPPSLRAPIYDPGDTSESLHAAWGLRFTPSPSTVPPTSLPSVPATLASAPMPSTHPHTPNTGDSMLNRLFLHSPETATEDTHVTPTSETGRDPSPVPFPTPTPAALAVPVLPPPRPRDVRPSTVSTIGGSIRPLLPAPAHDREPSLSEMSEATFYTVRSRHSATPSLASVLPQNEAGVGMALLSTATEGLPTFPVPPRAEGNWRTSAGGFYALPAESVASLPGAPHPPTPSTEAFDTDTDTDNTDSTEGGVYAGLGVVGSAGQGSTLSVSPRVVHGDAPSGGEHDWVADLDVHRTPTPSQGQAYHEPDPFLSTADEELSIRDLEREVALHPPYVEPSLRHWNPFARGEDDDGQSERYREIEMERSMSALMSALDKDPGAVGARERVSRMFEGRMSGAYVAGSARSSATVRPRSQGRTASVGSPPPIEEQTPGQATPKVKERRSAVNIAKAYRGEPPAEPLAPVVPAADPASGRPRADSGKLRKLPTGRPRR